MHVEQDKALVRVRDLRRMGYCHRGVRRWAERHGIDWADFVKNGIAVERLEAIDDAMCKRLIAAVTHGR